ncbi:MAG: carboxypeptidase-like regulatory domain-containing protein, partial [Prevotella sp.]
MTKVKRLFLFFTLLYLTTYITAADIKGIVKDATTKEPLIGATVLIDGTSKGTTTDIDGRFIFHDLEKGKKYSVVSKYIAYKTQTLTNIIATTDAVDIIINMQADEQTLKEVTVTGVARHNTEASMVQMSRNSAFVLNNVSAQEIRKTQDSNAGEVIRRIPGVSIIDDKFVMVRGLSQRYNNVWINGGAVPSSEADSRAFSFDIIPSGQIDNMVIVKTPSPEYPADYCGGFIIINTKEIPVENSFDITVGGSVNDRSHFNDFLYSKGSGTDFLGFDNGLRTLDGGIRSQLSTFDGNAIDLKNNGFNNDWLVKSRKPTPDIKLGSSLSHHWTLGENRLGLVAAFNYTNEWRTYSDMQNNLFGVYDITNDRSNYLRQSVDDQYNHNIRIGLMANMTLLSPSGKHKYQLKNIFNQIANNRYTYRKGITAQSNYEESAEYYYRSRTTYNGQITGKHTLGKNLLDWNAGYAYANRNIPDRRRYAIDDALDSGTLALTTGNEISREYTQLDEHIFSIGINDNNTFSFRSFSPSL